MQLVIRATSIAAAAVVSTSMLMNLAVAVEVTNDSQQVESPAAAAPVSEPIAPPSPNCFILGSRSFSIPFSVDAKGAQPVEVHLFVSYGPDQAWTLLDRKRPDIAKKQFQFEAERDGEFWFATRTIDATGQSHPDGAIESQLKVYVDTTKPNIKFDADADSDGRVDVTLTIDDATKLKDMQLRYITDNVNRWQPVDLGQLSSDGKLHFTPTDAWKQLSIQLVVTDTPGNQSVVNQLLRRPRLANGDATRFAADASRIGTDAMALPYRLGPTDRIPAHPVSNPVIKLDRHQPPPPPNVSTAHGYAPSTLPQGSTPFYGFRGAGGQGGPTLAISPPPHLSSSPQQRTYAAPPQSVPSFAAAPQAMQAQPARQAPPAAVTPPPASLFERLFGTAPAAPSTPQSMSFGPPSVRSSQASSRFAGNVNTGLPAPATPAEISHGFDLNSPGQSQSGQSQPETIPVPANPELAAEPQRPRPRTPAEAMRPITEPSEVESLSQEEVPTPKGDPESYRSRRATTAPSTVPPTVGDLQSMLQRAPVRYSNSEQFSLAYELEAVGVQGVEAIELYGSTDAGQTWELWGRDPDRTSPFDIETNETGVFGFRIVVVGRSGLASPRPMSRETPDIVVVVDSERPVVRITGAQYGEGDRIGSLVIHYDCTDANLKQRPIALSFSDSKEGPWTTIAAGLRNDGQYIWNADPHLPRQLYLRIDATDEAGNSGSYVLDQPIDAQGLAPRARIRGFQSISGARSSDARDQTATRPQTLFK